MGMPRRVKLTLEYDGTAFHGWQAQGGGEPGAESPGAARTVQAELERALRALLCAPIRVAGAGRTDEGVHAEGQVASFDLPDKASVPLESLCLALNARLPADVSALAAEEAPPDFHALASATGKLYRYLILNRPERGALFQRTHWHVRYPLDVERMRAAAGALVGRHDFAAFATELSLLQARRAAAGKHELSTVKELRRLEFTIRDLEPAGRSDWPAREIGIAIEGSGFLYKMVRTIAGSLADVGRGKETPEWLGEVLASRDRRRAGPTAPGKGLCLVKVLY